MTTKIPALFFTAGGCGPHDRELSVVRHERKHHGDGAFIVLRTTEFDLAGRSRNAGSYTLSPKTAAALHRQLGEALGIVRRAGNWTPPAGGERCFATVGDSEWCIDCGEHISRHFGGTEYRCDAKETP